MVPVSYRRAIGGNVRWIFGSRILDFAESRNEGRVKQ